MPKDVVNPPSPGICIESSVTDKPVFKIVDLIESVEKLNIPSSAIE